MRVLLDEDVHVKVIEWLTAAGHEVSRVPAGFKNGQVIDLAKRESRVLITRDKDFTNRFMYPPHQLPGIIVMRIHPPEFERLTAALRLMLSELPESELPGKLVVLEERTYHIIS